MLTCAMKSGILPVRNNSTLIAGQHAMSIHYDLHTHSTASDGTLTPTELVRRAHAHGVNVLALTDHDATDGLAEAGAVAQTLGLELVPGIEISVTWGEHTIHILGLGIDAGNAALQAGLTRLRSFRDWRAEEMGRRLELHGIPDAYAGAKKLAHGNVVSRTHFARFLVAEGHAATLQQVFKHFLVNRRPGYVAGDWASLAEAVGWINGAGGQAVIAHPARYKLTAPHLRRLITAFKECGGVGIEVVSGSHSIDDYHTIANYARQYTLLASRGSDYHGPSNPWIELGRLPELPASCVPIWSNWINRFQVTSGK